jgi:hypothetical protein
MSAGRLAAVAVLAAGAALTNGCGMPSVSHSSGIYLLLDTSGTYSHELDKAKQIINYTLSRLEPGDTFAVARIDTGSFSEKDIIAKVTLDDRPSTSNMEKRQFSKQVAEFLDHVQSAKHTDITGGLLQAVEFLNEKHPGRKTVLIFSDLEEDLEKGYVRDVSVPLDGFDVVALNVTKLRSDNMDPRKYLDRLDAWRKRVEGEGGSWRVINDLDRLTALLSS